VAKLDSCLVQRRPEGLRLSSWAEGSPFRCSGLVGDPSLRLKNGFARDDGNRVGAKLTHYQLNSDLLADATESIIPTLPPA